MSEAEYNLVLHVYIATEPPAVKSEKLISGKPNDRNFHWALGTSLNGSFCASFNCCAEFLTSLAFIFEVCKDIIFLPGFSNILGP